MQAQTQYYPFTITATSAGQIQIAIYNTIWVGFTKEMHERRVPDTVRGIKFAEYWTELGQPYLIVDTESQLFVWFISGGNALIEKRLATKYCPSFLKENVVTDAHPALGFVNLESVPKSSIVRAPNPKQRMRIIKRDQCKCRVCGRSPDNYSDIELHVHHIRPHCLGGLTVDWNLITLCHTCHSGLEPHHDPMLYNRIGSMKIIQNPSSAKQELDDGIRHYREIVR